MYKDKTENVEIYFICYKKEDMDLVETFYDEVLNIYYWYFNAYLAYQKWLDNFEGLKITDLSHSLLVVAASRYLIYKIENKEYVNKKEHKKLLKDLEKIQVELQKIVNLDDILVNI